MEFICNLLLTIITMQLTMQPIIRKTLLLNDSKIIHESLKES